MRLPVFTRYWVLGLVLLTISGCSGCGDDSAKPRKRLTPTEFKLEGEKLHARRMGVEKLYLTEDRRRVITTDFGRATIDPETGEIAWRTFQCNNPDCPGRGEHGEPFLFPWPDPLIYIQDGKLASRRPETEEDLRLLKEFGEQKCPACLELRDIEAESVDVRQQYQGWCRMYVLPGAQLKINKINRERQKLHRQMPMPKQTARPKAKKKSTRTKKSIIGASLAAFVVALAIFFKCFYRGQTNRVG